jgi:SAM-dependent methyltransferase
VRLCLKCGHEFWAARWCCPDCDWQAQKIEGFPSLAPEFAKAGGGFKPEYFAELARLEAGSFWFRSRIRLIIWALQHYFSKAGCFLEIGCRTAFVLSGIAQARPEMHLAGSEIFSQGLAFAAKRLPDVELMQMDARHIPYIAEFDAIGAFDVLEHIAEDETVLQEINRALKPNGGLLLTVSQHQFLWSAADESAQHVRRYCLVDLKEKVERAGFKILRSTSFVSLLIPLMLASRRRHNGTGNAQANAELALSKPIDTLLENVMRMELGLIRCGLNFPIGGSLLLIASKV